MRRMELTHFQDRRHWAVFNCLWDRGSREGRGEKRDIEMNDVLRKDDMGFRTRAKNNP